MARVASIVLMRFKEPHLSLFKAKCAEARCKCQQLGKLSNSFSTELVFQPAQRPHVHMALELDHGCKCT